MTDNVPAKSGSQDWDDEYFSTDFTRRQTLDMFAAGGLMAALGPLIGAMSSPAFASTDDEVVRIGYLPITDATALLVAHGMGYFEEEGLKAERPTLIRGWSPLVEGFVAGKFNLVHFLKPIPVWMRYNNNIPVKLMAWAHTNGSGLVVGGHTDITDFSQLGGKQVAVPFWYSMHNIVLQYALRQSGVKAVIKSQGEPIAADECNLQILPPPEMPAALASRKIDAYIVAEPFNAMGEIKAGARMLRFTGDIWKNHPCCVICMHEQATTEKQEWTQKVMNAVVKAQIYASQNKAEVARMMSKDGEGYLPMPAAIVERAMTDYEQDPDYIESGAIKHAAEWGNGRIDFQPWPYPSATKLIVEQMNNTLVGGDTTFLKDLDPQFVADDLVNYDYVRRALEKYPEWMNDPSVNAGDPFNRDEVLSL
ncbi:ABC-type nitrate/sulfonate/bicarbonate transport system, periplasmic component [Hoeflea phototrophica DFL-43]|uniref:ABC-type nitrate/sulfonate/bicarbonate transport system, periplasmic component n=1 Tax=Hoeflea phototrophica (strain DSM 17068 / NCIMB 14078 / DFL-43) TaxID=411684 RepID=A9DEF3_HOEPD|nr:ABC transporter substrate-binding protein [Hoeflea phototrophica]EDQ31808.2 ABC-type nitrate/sulfonate/bicarbonate transport system, periplasmic component [Hoeflea phototrophica DFL-43]